MSSRDQVLAFLIATFFLGWALAGAFAVMTRGPWSPAGAPAFGVLVLACPAVSAVLVHRFGAKQPLSEPLGLVLRPNRWLFFAWIVPFGVGAAVSAAIATFYGHVGPSGWAAELARGAGAGATINALFAAGEEIGWRGFLFSRWRAEGFRAAWKIGLVQAAWWTPMAAMDAFSLGALWISVPWTWAYAFAVAPLAWWVRERSGSTWAVCVFSGTLAAMDRVALQMALGEAHAVVGLRGIVGIGVLSLGSWWMVGRARASTAATD